MPADDPTLLAPSRHHRLLRVWSDGRFEDADFPAPRGAFDWQLQHRALTLFPSPDGRWVACPDGGAIWLHHPDGRRGARAMNLYLHAPLFSEPAKARVVWSAGSRRLLCQVWVSPQRARGVERDRVAVRYDLETGASERLAADGEPVGWLPNGDLLLAAEEDGRLLRVTAGGAVVPIQTPLGLRCAQLAPGGQAIAGVRGRKLLLIVPRTGEVTELEDIGPRCVSQLRWSPDGARIAWLTPADGSRWALRCFTFGRSARGAVASIGFDGVGDASPHAARFPPGEDVTSLRWLGERAVAISGVGGVEIVDSGTWRSLARHPGRDLPRLEATPRPEAQHERLRHGFVASLLRRSTPGADAALIADWQRVASLLCHPDPGRHAQALHLVESLDEPAIWRALAAAVQIRRGELVVADGGRAGPLTDAQLRAFLGAPGLQLSGAQQVQLALVDSRDLGALRPMGPLASLAITEGPALRRLSGGPPARTLNASRCPQLRDLRDLSGRSELEQLVVWHTRALTAVAGLRDLPALRLLSLGGGERLRRVEVGALSGLEELALRDCPALSELSGLSGSPIRKLTLRGCPQLRSLGLLAGMEWLETLELSDAGEWADVESLAELPALRMVGVYGERRGLWDRLRALGIPTTERSDPLGRWY